MGDERRARRAREGGRKSAIFGHARRELILKNPLFFLPFDSKAESGPIIHMCALHFGRQFLFYPWFREMWERAGSAVVLKSG